MIEQVVYVIRIVSLTIGMKKMKSPQERMNYVIKRLNMTKKWGGKIFLLEGNMEILSNKIPDFNSFKY